MNQQIPFEQEILEPNKTIIDTFFNIVKGPFKSDKKIGDLNGKWAIGLKLVIVLFFVSIPTFATWATWVTGSIYASNNHICDVYELQHDKRITELEKYATLPIKLERELQRLHDKIDVLPHPEWRRRIELLETQYGESVKSVLQVDKKNAEDHQQIFVLLESIKTKLDLIQK
jgi:hypothetical protein